MSDHDDEMRDLVRALFRRDPDDGNDEGTPPPDDTDDTDPDRATTRALFNNN